jgi:hypothetical protein
LPPAPRIATLSLRQFALFCRALPQHVVGRARLNGTVRLKRSMNFRLRKPDADFAEREECDRRYRDHLDYFSRRRGTDLWKFFYWDFFHDGSVREFAVSPDLATLTLRLVGPNIRWIRGDTLEYLNAEFIVDFRALTSLRFERTRDGADSSTRLDWLSEPLTFRYAEINTAPEVSANPNCYEEQGENLDSLMIEFCGSTSAWIEVTCAQIDVRPLEPVAFALMEADPAFRMPTFTEQNQAAHDER